MECGSFSCGNHTVRFILFVSLKGKLLTNIFQVTTVACFLFLVCLGFSLPSYAPQNILVVVNIFCCKYEHKTIKNVQSGHIYSQTPESRNTYLSWTNTARLVFSSTNFSNMAPETSSILSCIAISMIQVKTCFEFSKLPSNIFGIWFSKNTTLQDQTAKIKI